MVSAHCIWPGPPRARTWTGVGQRTLSLQILDVGWPELHAPPLDKVCAICKAQESWLDSDPQHVVVIHCRVSSGRRPPPPDIQTPGGTARPPREALTGRLAPVRGPRVRSGHPGPSEGAVRARPSVPAHFAFV